MKPSKTKEAGTAPIRVKLSTRDRLHKIRTSRKPIITLIDLVDELSKMKVAKID